MEQRDIEVIRIGEFAEFVDLFLGIYAVAGCHLGHQAVTVPRNSFQGDAEHLMHLAVGFGRLEEPDPPVVGVTDQPGEFVLPQLALHAPADAAGPKRETRHLNAGFTECHPFGGGVVPGFEEASGTGKCAGGEAGFQEITSGKIRHPILLQLRAWYHESVAARVTGRSGPGRCCCQAYEWDGNKDRTSANE
jgi:hypothetical protein